MEIQGLALIWTLGAAELAIIAVIVLIIFGPGKLPQVGKALGDGLKAFKRATDDKPEIDVTPSKVDELSESAKANAESPSKV